MPKSSDAALSEVVYEHIKELIFTKKILSGEKILEQDIVASLGISRTPVREAIRKLSGDGIVTIHTNRFAEVITFNDQSIKDLGVIRIMLDCLSAQLAIDNGSNNDFYELKNLSDQCKKAILEHDTYNSIKFDCDFHMMLVSISGNKFLIAMQKSLFLKTRLLQTIKSNDDIALRDIEDHEKIITALFERNIENAHAAIQSHLTKFYNLEGYEFCLRIKDLNLPVIS